MDRIRNWIIRNKIKVAPIVDKMRETRLRWFGHVKKRSVEAPVYRCEMIYLSECIRDRSQPKKSSNVVIRNDFKFLQLFDDIAQDMNLWRPKIEV